MERRGKHLLEYFSPIYSMQAVGVCVGKTVRQLGFSEAHSEERQ